MQKKLTKKALAKILAEHAKWLDDNTTGKQANLHRADLTSVNLRGANLHGADLSEANLSGADLANADLSEANLREANLRWANLYGADLTNADLANADLRRADLTNADLRRADLRGANIDFASWPLWCGSLDAVVNRRLFAQLAYHLCRMTVADPECLRAQKYLKKIANTFHRVGECGTV